MQNAVSDGRFYRSGWCGSGNANSQAGRPAREKQEQLLQTAQVYYEYGGSVAKAAEKLNLHKNTLLNCMKQLYQTLELEQDTVFVWEFLSECFWNTGICLRAVKPE
ncbi:MAG: helix-turn-helix domain-containing protein [Clostridium sp.]